MPERLSPPTPAALTGQVPALLRLAGPVIVARAGVLVMALVDTVMVGRFASKDLAELGLALVPVVLLMLIATGLLMGTLIVTSARVGAGREGECGAIWRRSLVYGAALGLLGAGICTLAEPLLRLTGQTPDLAAGAGAVARVLGLSLPAAMLYLVTAFFLEGLKRPGPGMLAMLVANLLNVALNTVLVYGHLGFPALGALGSAWATTVVRLLLALALITYVWCMADHARFGVRPRSRGGWRGVWRAGAHERRLGFAAGASIGVEAAAFAAVNLFAGWLGTQALAAYSIVLNLLSIVFMIAVGFGAATAVLVGHAHGAGDQAGAARAGWTGLAANSVVMACCAGVFVLLAEPLAHAYTTDPAVRALAQPMIMVAALILIPDGGQGVMASALRGLGDTWASTARQTVSYFVVMIPAAWLAGIAAGYGLAGLLAGILIGSIVAIALLCRRFVRLSTRGRRGSLSGISPLA